MALVFKTDYCQGLTDSLWKGRMRWIEQQAKRVPKGSKVLDVGAGEGLYSPYFSHCQYTAQDFTQTPGMTYGKVDVVSDITEIPLKSNTFDTILCTEVFEHVPHPEKALAEIVRLLKPGGKLIFSAPLGSGQHQMPYHYYGGYTRSWYEKFFPENDLKIVSLKPNGGLFGHLIELLWRSQPFTIEPWKKAGGAKRIMAGFAQIFIYNLPIVFLWQFEKRMVIEDFTVCFFVIAKKKSR